MWAGIRQAKGSCIHLKHPKCPSVVFTTNFGFQIGHPICVLGQVVWSFFAPGGLGEGLSVLHERVRVLNRSSSKEWSTSEEAALAEEMKLDPFSTPSPPYYYC